MTDESSPIEKGTQRSIPTLQQFKEAIKYLRSASFKGERISAYFQLIANLIELTQEDDNIQIVTWGRYVFLTNFQETLNEYQEGGVSALNNLTNSYLREGSVSLFYFTEDTQISARERIIEQMSEGLEATVCTLEDIVESTYY